MKKRKGLIIKGILILIVLILIVVIKNKIQDRQAGKVEQIEGRVPSSILIGAAASLNNNEIEIFDCTDAVCREIFITGDSYSSLQNGERAPFSGYADPSIRKDPQSDRIWMTYSYPYTKRTRGNTTVGVEIHYAHSDDKGGTWQYDGVLWAPEPKTNPVDGTAGSIEHEVSNILPVDDTWYAARLNYFLPEDGGFKERPSHSFYISLLEADSIAGLTNADPVTLGGAITREAWGVDIDLSQIDKELSDCMWWNEPALYSEDDTLYLGLRCMRFSGEGPFARPNVAQSNIVVFKAAINGNIENFEWEFAGTLASNREAKQLGGFGLSQIDFAKGQNGEILLITSPDEHANGADFIHYGCRAVEVGSLDTPYLATHENGALKVRAWVDASDQGELGPGACAYERSAQNGIIMVKREIEKGKFWASMHSTNVKP